MTEQSIRVQSSWFKVRLQGEPASVAKTLGLLLESILTAKGIVAGREVAVLSGRTHSVTVRAEWNDQEILLGWTLKVVPGVYAGTVTLSQRPYSQLAEHVLAALGDPHHHAVESA